MVSCKDDLESVHVVWYLYASDHVSGRRLPETQRRKQNLVEFAVAQVAKVQNQGDYLQCAFTHTCTCKYYLALNDFYFATLPDILFYKYA